MNQLAIILERSVNEPLIIVSCGTIQFFPALDQYKVYFNYSRVDLAVLGFEHAVLFVFIFLSDKCDIFI